MALDEGRTASYVDGMGEDGPCSESVLVSAGKMGMLEAMERGVVFDVRVGEDGELVMAWAGEWQSPLDKRRSATYVDGMTMGGPCWGGRGEGPGFVVGVSCLCGSL